MSNPITQRMKARCENCGAVMPVSSFAPVADETSDPTKGIHISTKPLWYVRFCSNVKCCKLIRISEKAIRQQAERLAYGQSADIDTIFDRLFNWPGFPMA